MEFIYNNILKLKYMEFIYDKRYCQMTNFISYGEEIYLYEYFPLTLFRDCLFVCLFVFLHIGNKKNVETGGLAYLAEKRTSCFFSEELYY